MANYDATSNKNGFIFRLAVAQTSQNVEKNQSTITFNLQMINDDSYHTSWYGYGSSLSYKITINGTSYSGNVGDYHDDYENTTKTLIVKNNTTQTINHNANGSKTINVSFSVTDSSGAYYTCGSASKSGTFTLTTIPRASTFSISATSAKVEDSLTATITSASSSFTHKFGWWIGKTRYGNLISVNGLRPSVPVPSALYDVFLRDGNTTVSQKFSLNCHTYSGNTLIGTTTKEITISLSASRCKPIIEKIEITDVVSGELGLINGDETVFRKDAVVDIKLTYKYGSDNYAKKISNSNNTSFNQEQKNIAISSPIKVSDRFTTSDASYIKDYTIYIEPKISINTPTTKFEVLMGTEELEGYKITDFKTIIDYNFLSFNLSGDIERTSFSYRYYLGINKDVEDNQYSSLEQLSENETQIIIEKVSNDISITLDDLLTPFYLIVEYTDGITTQVEKKEIRISPLFDWNQDNFNFNIPLEINRDQRSGQAWFSIVDRVGGGLNMKNSDIVGINTLYFSDTSSAAQEGIGFPHYDPDLEKGQTPTYDFLSAYGGHLIFKPNYPSNTTKTNLVYGVGDVMVIKDNFPLHGYITNGGKRVFLSIPLSRPLSPLVKSFNFSSGTMQGRGVGGYIKNPATNAAEGNFNFLNAGDKITVEKSITNSDALFIKLEFSEAIGSNNTPISVCPVGQINITFTDE